MDLSSSGSATSQQVPPPVSSQPSEAELVAYWEQTREWAAAYRRESVVMTQEEFDALYDDDFFDEMERMESEQSEILDDGPSDLSNPA